MRQVGLKHRRAAALSRYLFGFGARRIVMNRDLETAVS